VKRGARTFTEIHPALPSPQRVNAPGPVAFLVAGDELLARRENAPPQRLSLDEAHGRGRELATVVSELDAGA
jgi:hypothetical protein